MVELHIDLIAESLSIYGSKVNIVDTEVTEFTGFKLLSPNIQTLRKDILYVCEPSALYKLKKSQIRGACFVCRAQAHVFEKYKAYINAIVVDYDTNTNDIANHLADLFSSMNDYKTRLQHAVLLQKGYQPLFDIAKEMFPGCTILMVDSGYNIVCSANTDFENDILPGADPDAVEHMLLVVSDMSARSLETACGIMDVAKRGEDDIRIGKSCLVLNRVKEDNPKDELLEKANVEVIARFPEDPVLNKFDREGRSLLELPDESGCVLEARRLVEEILA